MNARTLGLVTAVALALGAVGCVENRVFFIRQNQVPFGDCEVDTNAQTFRGRGILDVAGKRGYLLFPLVENALPPSQSLDDQPERNLLLMTGFKIEIKGLPGGVDPSLASFTERVTATLEPGGQAVFGGIEIIPAAVAQQLSIPEGQSAEVLVVIKAVAEHGGDEKESPEFEYPVELCNQCLVDLRGSCPTAEEAANVLTNPCGLPQDSPVTCCPSGGQILCYSEVPST